MKFFSGRNCRSGVVDFRVATKKLVCVIKEETIMPFRTEKEKAEYLEWATAQLLNSFFGNGNPDAVDDWMEASEAIVLEMDDELEF